MVRLLLLIKVALVSVLASACSSEESSGTEAVPGAEVAVAAERPTVIQVVPGSEAALTFVASGQTCIVALRGDSKGEPISCGAVVSFFAGAKGMTRGSVIHVKTIDGVADKVYYKVTSSLRESGFVVQPVITVGFITEPTPEGMTANKSLERTRAK
jgi:hypothetical protein